MHHHPHDRQHPHLEARAVLLSNHLLRSNLVLQHGMRRASWTLPSFYTSATQYIEVIDTMSKLLFVHILLIILEYFKIKLMHILPA